MLATQLRRPRPCVPDEGAETVLVICSRKSNQIQINIGYAVLMNATKLAGIDRRLVDLIPIDPGKRMDHLRANLSSKRAIYAFGITIGNGQIDEANECVRIIKEANPDNIVIYGGPLASSSPKLLLTNCDCDYVLAGEAELSFPELLKRLLDGDEYPCVDDISGLYYRQDGKIVGKKHKSIGAQTDNPDYREGRLGIASNPDYKEFDMRFYIGYLKETGQAWEIMASRGCVASCTFCYKMVGHGLSVRSVDDVLDEMEMIMTKWGIDRFYFVDDSLLVMIDWYWEFLRKKRERGLNCKFIIQARIDAIDEEMVRAGVENGLVCISTGVEVTTQLALDACNKSIKIGDITDKIALVRKHGVGFSANFIVGFKDDTEATFEQMLEFIRANGLEENAKVSYLTPLPHTAEYGRAIQRRLISDEWAYVRSMGDLYFELVLNVTESVPDDRLRYWYERIAGVGQRQMVMPVSGKYANKLAGHYTKRVGEDNLIAGSIAV